MAAAAFRNFFQSALIVLRERPQIVISTGAGSVFFTVLWSRLIGAKVVVIESFARFEGLSAFARLARPLAHQGVVQSKGLARLWPEAAVFDPMRMIPPPTQEKAPMVFVTVGATLPFDRLVKGVADLKAIGDIPETVRIQTGIGGYRAAGIETAETLPFDEVLSVLEVADIVVCHGGTGSLITALRQGCRVVAMPRSFEMGEHYDNHQLEIIDAFAARGLISVAKSVEDLGPALRAARAKPRVAATSEPRELNDFLKHLLAQWSR